MQENMDQIVKEGQPQAASIACASCLRVEKAILAGCVAHACHHLARATNADHPVCACLNLARAPFAS